ncbi:suppressor protein stp22 of temperature-sensitive alpha-factor receptor and arginine permease [Ciborinia camelliae]|nr:suppressor protein stp22 of temperature-sensitive alpha-factor receptor and arginine permease [Ciborinia camelliae]
MAVVQQRVLNWLYSVLTSTGASSLLLHLSGTLPVNFRGTTYRFPIALWIPHAYPQEAPLVYVTPVEGMVVRAGQHVDPQGKVYHPYLMRWPDYWDKSNIIDFLAILRDIFAKEPPVISRQQQNAPPRPQSTAIPPPIPPLPPNISRSIPNPASPHPLADERPPPPPPKPTSNTIPYSPSGSSRRDSGPPLPPLPTQGGYDNGRYGPPMPQSPNRQSHTPQRSSSLRYESAPPLPPQQSRQNLPEPSYSPVSPITPPEDPYRQSSYSQSYQQPPQSQQPQHPSPQQSYHLNNVQQPTPQNGRPPPPQYMHPQQQQQQPYPGHPPHQQWPRYQQQQPPPPQPQAKPPPPPDLLDAPLTLSIPDASSANLPAPPVPPNPEKDMLLQKLAIALHSQRLHHTTQTTSSLPGLHAQQTSMLSTLNSMQSELSALESLSTLLATNTNILHTSLQTADQLLQSSQHRTPPSIDELLVAPTVAGNQLYELVCEERSLGDAIDVLGRAVERGRISGPTFAKLTRGLAREWFLKKALVRKIGRGMGLSGVVGQGGY